MAAGNTYTPLATTTLASAASSYTFSSISGSYTDLVLVAAVQNTANTGDEVAFQVNGDTTTNYSRTRLYGNGSTAGTSTSSAVTKGALGINSTTDFSVITANFQNYSNSTTYKPVISRGSSSGYTSVYASLWRSTSAITSITILPDSGTTFTTGSTFTLYGILAA